MEILSLQEEKDRISELPDDILVDCLSLLDMKCAAQTSILSRRWRYSWAYLSSLDFDPELMYPEEFNTFLHNETYETRKYFAWINQVVSVHRGTSIDTFKIRTRFVRSYTTQLDKWVKFALSKGVKQLELRLIGINFRCKDWSEKGYPFGFDTLRHPPCYTGIITRIQSLHLLQVNVSEEFLEFLLSRCHHLERLYLDSAPLSNFKVKSSKLKYLSIIMRLSELEELEIDAENLLYFLYEDFELEGGPRITFKNVPKLVEMDFKGGFCRYPFPIFEKLSHFATRLCKLSLYFEVEFIIQFSVLVIPDGVIPTFPNVKHFTCSTYCYEFSCILAMKRFIEACPTLEEFKLQVLFGDYSEGFCEATELQEIDLEDNDRENFQSETIFNCETARVPEIMNEEKETHPNLRILEIVGFMGTKCDIQFTLAIVSYACSLKTIICDPQGVRYSSTYGLFLSDTDDQYDVAKMRARKLAKIVAPKVQVVII